MTESAAMRPKTYSYLTDAFDDNKTAKDRKMYVTKQNINPIYGIFWVACRCEGTKKASTCQNLLQTFYNDGPSFIPWHSFSLGN